jgi:ABC-type multidrug transport system fused ATPase/permease subunit
VIFRRCADETFYQIAKKELTPAVAFPGLSVLQELQFSLSALPETAISVLQGFVSLRRIQKYLSQAEIVPGTDHNTDDTVSLRSATLTWPRDVASGTATAGPASVAPSGTNTPSGLFTLADVNIEFPIGQLSIVAGRLGAGKTLLLSGLLGEADLLAGQILCPRSPVSAIEDYGGTVPPEDWILRGRTAFASQVPFLINGSLRQNIIFGAPEDEARFRSVIQACSLQADLELLEDGEWTEIGEKGGFIQQCKRSHRLR